MVVEDGMSIEHEVGRYAKMVLQHNRWGKEHGRSLFVTEERRDGFFDAMEKLGGHGRCLEVDDVDVKDLLELGRVVIEKSALETLLEEHQSDLESNVRVTAPTV